MCVEKGSPQAQFCLSRVFMWSLAVPPQASLRKSPTLDGISQGRAASLVPFSCTPVKQGLVCMSH